MQTSVSTIELSPASLALDFFRESAGIWKSQRRYYTLTTENTQEVISYITVSFLEANSPDLIKLASLHQLENKNSFVGGASVTWESDYISHNQKKSTGSTIFGVLGDYLYRDRGFATTEPITARFYFTNSQTMCLKSEYQGSIFEEELKLIGKQYRTRQTIISRAGKEQMIGQYLEKRIV